MNYNKIQQYRGHIYIVECADLNIHETFTSLVKAKRRAESLGFKIKSPLWNNFDTPNGKIFFREYSNGVNNLLLVEKPHANKNDDV